MVAGEVIPFLVAALASWLEMEDELLVYAFVGTFL